MIAAADARRTAAVWLLLALFAVSGCSNAAELPPQEIATIAQKVYQNECSGKPEKLIVWNAGENFPSLGIGHFIWYPQGVRGPFTESFPALLAFAAQYGIKPPAGLTPQSAAPWHNREQFLTRQQSPFTRALRQWLEHNREIQAAFLIYRFNRAVPRILKQAPPSQRTQIASRIEAMLALPQGAYALIDYVNFKGEGINSDERYHGEGWGLLQVLQNMQAHTSLPDAFADSAAAILTRRVQNAPPQRNEQRWLPGWLNRIESYRSS